MVALLPLPVGPPRRPTATTTPPHAAPAVLLPLLLPIAVLSLTQHSSSSSRVPRQGADDSNQQRAEGAQQPHAAAASSAPRQHQQPRPQQSGSSAAAQPSAATARQRQEQQQQQHPLLLAVPVLRRPSVKKAELGKQLQQCSDWPSLAAWLGESRAHFPSPRKQQGQPQQRQQWPECLSSQQCLRVVQQAVVIAASSGAQQQLYQQYLHHGSSSSRHWQQQQHSASLAPARQAGVVSLQAVLLRMVATAAAGLRPGEPVRAAELLRALWWLSSSSNVTQQQQQQQQPGQLGASWQRALGQQLLQQMCSQRLPAATAAEVGASSSAAGQSAAQLWGMIHPTLFADMCLAVMGLQLQPDRAWAELYCSTSLALLQQGATQAQQQQQHATVKLRPWLLVVTLDLMARLQQQQQQLQGVLPAWRDAWLSAAAALRQPFSTQNMLLVTQAWQQLQQEQPLAGSFWAKHLDAAAVQQLRGQEAVQLLLLVQQLPPVQPATKEQQQVPAAWLAAAADALPASLAAAAAGPPPVWVLQQGAAAVRALLAAGWQGPADATWCARVWAAVLALPVTLKPGRDGDAERSSSSSSSSSSSGGGEPDTRAAVTPKSWVQLTAALEAALTAGAASHSKGSVSGTAAAAGGQAAAGVGIVWAAALQNVLLMCQQHPSGQGYRQQEQQQSQPRQGLLQELPASTAAGLLVALVQSRQQQGPGLDSSSSSVMPLARMLLQCLSGQLGALQLRHLLPLGRALLTPVAGLSSSDDQQQQWEAASGGSEPQCLLQCVPQLVGEFMEQVALQLPAAGLDGLDSALWTVRQMLRVQSATAGGKAASTAANQQREQQEQQLSQLLTAGMQQLQHILHNQQQQQPKQRRKLAGTALQAQALLSLLQLATHHCSTASSSSSSSSHETACHQPSAEWWCQWFAAAGDAVLEAATLQQLLAMAVSLRRAMHAGLLQPTAAAGSSSGGASVPATAAQTWLESHWLEAVTARLGPEATNLSLQQQADVAAAVSGLGLQPSSKFLQLWGDSSALSMQAALSAAADAADTAAFAAAGVDMSAAEASAAAEAAAAVAAQQCLLASLSPLAATAETGWVLPASWLTAAAQLVLGVVTATTAAVTVTATGGSDQQQQQQQRPAMVHKAAQVVLMYAKATRQQPAPDASWLQQLEQQLPQLLQHGNMQSVAKVLWAYAAHWRTSMAPQCLSSLLSTAQLTLESSSSGGNDHRQLSHLRVLLLALALLKVQQLPQSWWKAVLQYTWQAMDPASTQQQQQLSSSDSHQQQQQPARGSAYAAAHDAAMLLLRQQRQQSSAAQGTQQLQPAYVLAGVAFALAKLGVTPGSRWQQLWRQQVAAQLPHMSPDQLTDCLYAAAVWHQAAVAAAAAASADWQGRAGAGGEATGQPTSRAASQPVATGSSSSSTAEEPGAAAEADPTSRGNSLGGSNMQLQRPQYRPVAATTTSNSSSRSSSRESRQQAAASAAATTSPDKPWLEGLLQQMRRRGFGQCRAKQLTVALWSLGQLGLKAPVEWLDELYDALLLQLPACSMEQLLQLLQGLLHQQHDLAPARVDAVLQQCLLHLTYAAERDEGQQRQQRQSYGSRSLDPQLLLWLLQLVVKLRHEPSQQWCADVAEAVQNMLTLPPPPLSQRGQQDSNYNSAQGAMTVTTSSSGGSKQPHRRVLSHAPEMLVELLEHLAVLEFDLPAADSTCLRSVLRPLLPCLTGQQLAAVLSAAVRLHWFRHEPLPPPADSTAAGRQSRPTPCRQRQRRSGHAFLSQLLQQLRLQLASLDPGSLGLVGAAVSQLGLQMHAATWVGPYMAAVKVVAASPLPLSSAHEVTDLQRSVQYLSWCSRGGAGGGSVGSRGRSVFGRARARRGSSSSLTGTSSRGRKGGGGGSSWRGRRSRLTKRQWLQRRWRSAAA